MAEEGQMNKRGLSEDRPHIFAKKGRLKRAPEEKRLEDREQREEMRRDERSAVDRLIEEAMIGAAKEGSEMEDSQKWSERVRQTVEGHLQKLGPEFTFSQLGELLHDVLFLVEKNFDVSRSWSNVGKRSIFPLPTSSISKSLHQPNPFLQAVAAGLNSLNGSFAAEDFEGSDASVRALKRLGEILDGSPLMNEVIPRNSFTDFFKYRGINYQGEEIRLARKLTWEGIEASLPEEVASLDIREFCTGGVLHYINNFEHFMIPKEDQVLGPPPKIMVETGEWSKVARGLVDRGLCTLVRESEIYHVRNRPLWNGLFSVSKQEFKGNVEICRLIMNLKPVNALCLGLTADTDTLPTITSMTGFYIDESEVLALSSEDIRCFFYLFKVPGDWVKFTAFGRAAPDDMVPSEFGDEKGYLCSRVLPMGFVNSVGIAQHVHRNVIKRAVGKFPFGIGGEAEIRRDRTAPHGKDLFRIYLDNFDELKLVDSSLAAVIEGEVSSLVSVVRDAYEECGLPRHPKKSVSQQFQGEVQGAWVDGKRGTMMAKPSKVVKYVGLALELIKDGKASQKELQVVGGGLVYIAMFRRPSLCGLNHIWRMIVALDARPHGTRVRLKREVVLELARFLTLLPLCFMNFRAPFDEMVTASDASTHGGGICMSKGLTPYGELALHGSVRGDSYEDPNQVQVLSIGLFDGISALRVALDGLHAPVLGHVSVEMQPEARRVVEAFFPDTVFVEDIALIDEKMVQEWSVRYGTVGLVLIGSGPPCQGVSGLNADRRGALRDHRSKLFHFVPKIAEMIKRFFPWSQVHTLTENVASMDPQDCSSMNEEFQDEPWMLDAEGISLARRPRLYWVSWELQAEQGAELCMGVEHKLPLKGVVSLQAEVNEKEFLEPGWRRSPGQTLPTFTTSRPSSKPMRKPAGLHLCNEHELTRWRADKHRFPPYQYRDVYTLQHAQREARPPSVREREAILGFPLEYTKQCMVKQYHDSESHRDCRLTLLGNSWSVPVVAWLIKNLLSRLGVIPNLGVQELVDRFTPGKDHTLQGLLLRPPLCLSTSTLPANSTLVQKLFGLTSLKGEDLMVHGVSEPPVRYHRLRSSIPSRLWRWKTVSGWAWKNKGEHINALELRAVYTTLRWRVEEMQQRGQRFAHLVDSLVALHSLSRGRSSSRKLMRTVMRINSLLLVSGLHALWAYVDTKQNPADKPSRWGAQRRWVRKKPKC